MNVIARPVPIRLSSSSGRRSNLKRIELENKAKMRIIILMGLLRLSPSLRSTSGRRSKKWPGFAGSPRIPGSQNNALQTDRADLRKALRAGTSQWRSIGSPLDGSFSVSLIIVLPEPNLFHEILHTVTRRGVAACLEDWIGGAPLPDATGREDIVGPHRTDCKYRLCFSPPGK